MRIAVAGATGQVGRRLGLALRQDGHEVVELTRGAGFDLADEGGGRALTDRLRGVDALVDLTNLVTQDRSEATDFFSTVARNVGRAATGAGVPRTVLLSIIGVDGIPDDAHYAGKYQQELGYLEHAPGVRIVRAAQFHEFPGMVLEWGRDGGRATVPDFPVQPVHLDVVVRALADAATGSADRVVLDVAGPRPERLPELVARLVRARGEAVDVAATPASPELAAGACLPGEEALIAGPSFDEWLAETPADPG